MSGDEHDGHVRGQMPIAEAGGVKLALLGILIGLGSALVATRVLASLLYGVSTSDPLTMTGTAALLLVAAMLASWAPAMRAARVDPSVSPRAD